MNVRPSLKPLSLGVHFAVEAWAGDLPNPEIGLEPIDACGEESSLWLDIVHQYNTRVQENSDYVLALLSSPFVCETSVSSLMADVSRPAHEKMEIRRKSKTANFAGVKIITIQDGGKLKLSDEWKYMIENSYMIFDEKSGMIFVANEDEIPDAFVEEGLSKMRRAYTGKARQIPKTSQYISYSYYRSIPVNDASGASIDPSVFKGTGIDESTVFDDDFKVRLKGHGSYFTIERADGGWNVPLDQMNKFRNLIVGIICKAIEVKARPSSHGQNPIGLVSGDASDAHLLESAELSR